MPTPAHRERNKRYKQTQDQIVLTVPRGARDAIKEYASNKGRSVNSYITTLIEDDIGCSVEELAKKNKASQE